MRNVPFLYLFPARANAQRLFCWAFVSGHRIGGYGRITTGEDLLTKEPSPTCPLPLFPQAITAASLGVLITVCRAPNATLIALTLPIFCGIDAGTVDPRPN